MSNAKSPVYKFKALTTTPDIQTPSTVESQRRGMFPEPSNNSKIIGDNRPDERPHLDAQHPAFKGMYKDKEFGEIAYEIVRKVELKDVSGFVYTVNIGIEGIAPIIFFFNGIAEDKTGRMSVDLRRLSIVPEESGISTKVDDMLQRLVMTLLPTLFNYYQEIKAARAAESDTTSTKV